MRIYVVTCFVEGCEECSDVYHVVNVFTKKDDAEICEKEHRINKGGHLHCNNVDIVEKELEEGK